MPSSDAQQPRIGAALVVGGGIGGMQAALDLAASGIKVHLVDRSAAIGGKMSQLDKTFPTNDCAMCTMAPRLVEISGHRDIQLHTLSDVEAIDGQAGRFTATVRTRPRYIDSSRCNGCAACVSNCPTRNQLQPPGDDVPEVDPEPAIRQRVAEIVERHRRREGPLMPILQEINASFHWFPPGVLDMVARQTGYSLAHLLRIATFYSAFSVVPRGKLVINVCQGTACHVSGGPLIMERVADLLGIAPEQTTPDMQFTLKAVRCIGCCGLAPAMMVGDVVHGKVTLAGTSKIIDGYRGA